MKKVDNTAVTKHERNWTILSIPRDGLFTILSLLIALTACSDQIRTKNTTADRETDNGAYGRDQDTNTDGDADQDVEVDAGTIKDVDLCFSDTPPGWCGIAAQPACGDGVINVDGEECDDGNTIPGDGCTGLCKIEADYLCPIDGQPCVSQLVCGNGEKERGEVCDDGNNVADDGCDPTCTTSSPDYLCSEPGVPCIRISFCGNGRIQGTETCEDDNDPDNLQSGDGCDENCQTEPGWRCPLPGRPCEAADVCGDGRLSPTTGEACDDGNVIPGDGCSADCRNIEDDYECPAPGQPCRLTAACGDGKPASNETCDDGNTTTGDGCDAACQTEEGYGCPFLGAPCIAVCGDGIVLLNEECDDGNTDDLDGCSNLCEWEEGWGCTGSSKDGTWECHKTVCGDGIAEGTEACDDGNKEVGDGCTPFCQIEPDCPAQGACNSVCGDSIILANAGEECDDGNAVSNDGCSADCKIEPGYECVQPALSDEMIVPLVVRDFTREHDDFEFQADNEGDIAYGLIEATTGLVRDTLDAASKPVFTETPATTDAQLLRNGLITSSVTFNTWYRSSSDPAATIAAKLVLYGDGNGNYVNRYGASGQKWERVGIEYDGNPVFFPIDEGGITPKNEYQVAKIPPYYFGWDGKGDLDDTCLLENDCNPCWPLECITGVAWSSDDPAVGDCSPAGEDYTWFDCYDESPRHNFHFTSQVTYWFEYDADTSPVLRFVGDDDLWVFLNGKLAIDLGGIHVALEGELVIDESTALEFDLQDGNIYEIVVFHAERQTFASTYKLTLSGFNSEPSECRPVCGDGIPVPGEQCDDGAANADAYGACRPDCTLGPYCGDGILNGSETCDDGENTTPYGGPDTGCSPGCVSPPFCGDGVVQTSFGETCDDKINDGSYGGCTPTCQNAPWCGDGLIDPEEQCDDGVNDGSYNNCAPECVVGPRCGDGIVNGPEDCDDGNTIDGDGCSSACLNDGCGDGLVQSEYGEECDDGVNTGGYSGCAPDCLLGPHCGDGAVQSEHEECDDGVNAGEYGGCATGCVFGPRCGDGILHPAHEECDDPTSNRCTPQCTNVVISVI